MADPTLKDVLKAFTALNTKIDALATKAEVTALAAKVDANHAELTNAIAEVKADVAEVKADVAEVKADVAGVKADVAAHRAETKKGFADLDKELDAHSERSHRELERRLDKVEKDVATLKGRPAARPARRSRTPRGR
jgi:chromosome segregation ATPase